MNKVIFTLSIGLLLLPVACTKSILVSPTAPISSPVITQPTAVPTGINYLYQTQWGATGSGNSQFNGLEGIVVDSAGNVYVADNGNSRIQKFSSTGSYIGQWGTFGTGNGQFQGTSGIAIDPSDNIYVVDNINEKCQKFTSAG